MPGLVATVSPVASVNAKTQRQTWVVRAHIVSDEKIESFSKALDRSEVIGTTVEFLQLCISTKVCFRVCAGLVAMRPRALALRVPLERLLPK